MARALFGRSAISMIENAIDFPINIRKQRAPKSFDVLVHSVAFHMFIGGYIQLLSWTLNVKLHHGHSLVRFGQNSRHRSALPAKSCQNSTFVVSIAISGCICP
jgi:hypothetical protein